ncbi:hypothetical protein M378DRAFT_92477, partial [Amanita muscaria Koide BX008]
PQRRQAWFRSVTLTRPESVELAKGDQLPLMLILDCRTRWSSTDQMLECALKFEGAIDHFVATHKDLCQHALSTEDWANIRRVKGWLHLFREATTQMSSTSSPMLSTTHAIFRGLQDELKAILRSLPNDVAPQIKGALIKAHRKLSDYFYKFDISPYPLWAAYPRIGYIGLKDDYVNDVELVEGLQQSKIALERHFNQFYAGHFASCNPIQWWYANRIRSRFPNLYWLAKDLLAIPGSAVAVERIFSGGRDTISMRRASLKPNTIHSLMLVKQRIRMHQS